MKRYRQTMNTFRCVPATGTAETRVNRLLPRGARRLLDAFPSSLRRGGRRCIEVASGYVNRLLRGPVNRFVCGIGSRDRRLDHGDGSFRTHWSALREVVDERLRPAVTRFVLRLGDLREFGLRGGRDFIHVTSIRPNLLGERLRSGGFQGERC